MSQRWGFVSTFGKKCVNSKNNGHYIGGVLKDSHSEELQRDSYPLMTDLVPDTTHILSTYEYPSVSWTFHSDHLEHVILSSRPHTLYDRIIYFTVTHFRCAHLPDKNSIKSAPVGAILQALGYNFHMPCAAVFGPIRLGESMFPICISFKAQNNAWKSFSTWGTEVHLAISPSSHSNGVK